MSDVKDTGADASSEFLLNMEKIDELTKRLAGALAKRGASNPKLSSPDPSIFAKAASGYFTDMITNPARIIEQQMELWTESVNNWSEVQKTMLSSPSKAPPEARKDRRFKNELWDTHPYFSLVKRQYALTTKAIEQALSNLDELEPSERERIEFFTHQILDMMAPNNFLTTNPDALEKAVETEGQSLIRGLENLVRDVETNEGEMAVTLADQDAFEVGVNIASSPGAIVYQNRMMQLIQYSPTTEKVNKAPLIIFPPWINKFYILDLKEKNSLIHYAVSRGLTVYVVSWVNPDESYRDDGLDSYLKDGLLKAVEVVKDITGEKQVNTIGYCIGGTLLTIALAYMQKVGDKSIRSATFFTTMTDFSKPGDLGFFLDEKFMEGLENEVEQKGYLSHFFMSRTFSYLRANDLVYAPAIRSYMLGEAPPAFDLLYWNGDSTNLPGRMAKEYLRYLYLNNDLANGRFEILGETVDMKDIAIPIYAVATQTDHIAPWKSSFSGLAKTSGKKTFVLSESGHIAGIVNPASANKYGNWTNQAEMKDPDAWLETATFQSKSWWHGWSTWIKRRSGKLIPARNPGSKSYPVIEKAPGTYAKIKVK
ncbi:MAG: class I poly(R)-hydroxyalkanoic acid synthase [bacterium]|nr:class I poly(R)-hydroxyalkanoic acid synthase [bacterium]